MPRARMMVTFHCGCRKPDPFNMHPLPHNAVTLKKTCDVWCPLCDSLPARQKKAKAVMLGQDSESVGIQSNEDELRRIVAAELPSSLPGHAPGALGRQLCEMSVVDQDNLRKADERFFEHLEDPDLGQSNLSEQSTSSGMRVLSPVEKRPRRKSGTMADTALTVKEAAREKHIETLWQQVLERDRISFQFWLEERHQALGDLHKVKDERDAAAAAAFNARFEARMTLKEERYAAACVKYARIQSLHPVDSLHEESCEAKIHAEHEHKRTKWNIERREEDDLFGSGYRARILAQCLIHGNDAGCGEKCRAQCAVHGAGARCGVSCRAIACNSL